MKQQTKQHINAEYIWLDGTTPTHLIRSKTRVIETASDTVTLTDIPEWGFDGSSTNQAEGSDSDCILKPVSYRSDPIRGNNDILVMCEVYKPDGTPHPTNTRYKLRNALDNGGTNENPVFGFEQEYTLFKNSIPLGWPENGFPAPQGPYYCGVGTRVFGRPLVEDHLKACKEAGLLIYGINAEVMPGQWEFQIGYRGFEGDNNNALQITDDMWYATWLLNRLSENYNITVSYDNKPIKGDWNGAGCHTNFSTDKMRNEQTGKEEIKRILTALEKNHEMHIKNYGFALDERLTGEHETCAINEFRYGDSDRGASIRVPVATTTKGYGYLEDRRPGANSDPYLVSACIIATICNLDFSFIQKNTAKTPLVTNG
jgi:glutamine synthetase